jgi:ATP/maltotriose-dependent transcriptional regulator MalT
LQADGWPVAHEAVRFAFPIAVEAAIDLGDLDEADRLIKMLSTRPRGEVPPFLRAQITRSKALVTSARGENETVEEHLTAVEEAFAELGYPYWTARAQLDRAEWLARQGRVEESTVLAAKAAAAFEAIGAAPMLLRASLLAQPDLSRSGQDGP